MEFQPSLTNPALQSLAVLIGEWEIEISAFEADPSARFHGHTSFRWLEGGAFLQQHAQVPGTDFPSVTAVIGPDDEAGIFCMLYFDSRGVSRIYQMSLEQRRLTLWRDFPGFSQRFVALFNADYSMITGSWEKSTDGSSWEHDFDIRYVKINIS